MKDGKKIAITRPRLLAIRKNFRIIFISAVEERLKDLRRSKNLAWKNRFISEYTEIAEKRRQLLNADYNKLLANFHHSILYCSGGCKGDGLNKNMVYIAQYNGWFCEECYNDMQETTDPKRWFNESIMVDENAEKPCYVLNWCPYGGLVEAFRIRKEISRYTWKSLVMTALCFIYLKKLWKTQLISQNIVHNY